MTFYAISPCFLLKCGGGNGAKGDNVLERYLSYGERPCGLLQRSFDGKSTCSTTRAELTEKICLIASCPLEAFHEEAQKKRS